MAIRTKLGVGFLLVLALLIFSSQAEAASCPDASGTWIVQENTTITDHVNCTVIIIRPMYCGKMGASAV